MRFQMSSPLSPRLSRVRPLSLAFALLLSLAAPAAALAQAAPGGGFDPADIDKITASVRQVPLTADMVDRLIASFPDMRRVAAKFGGAELPAQAGVDAAGIAAMPAAKRKALEAVAAEHGFESLNQWTDVASSVTMTYVYAMQGKKPGSLDEAVKANIAQAERDPTLSAEQKQQTVAQYKLIGDKLARLEPLQENYTLIVEMKDKITPLMDPN
jgi:hypothetical protein